MSHLSGTAEIRHLTFEFNHGTLPVFRRIRRAGSSAGYGTASKDLFGKQTFGNALITGNLLQGSFRTLALIITTVNEKCI